MRDIEIQLFSDGMNLAKEEFFLDAISHMNQLVKDFPDSELADDAIYNIGLCYFNLNQFDKAINYFYRTINEYPDGTISVLTGGNEYGHTAAKCYYAIMNCQLALGKMEEANITLSKLSDYSESYVQQQNGVKLTYEELAKNSLKIFINQKIKK